MLDVTIPATTPRERFLRLEGRVFVVLVAIGLVLVAIGAAAALLAEERGHVITHMDNQVVWGTPHVFAILLIVCASGALNVASVGSVFGRIEYKARAPLSGLLALTLLAGGLAVLMLDLGRPERISVAATHFNFRSVFAWNVFLYSGFFAIVAGYLWMLMERRMNRWTHAVGVAAFGWRFALTTGTGSIFGFLAARQAYQSAVLAPMFIVMSLAWGLAAFLIVQLAMYRWAGRELPATVQRTMSRLLAVFVFAVLYFVFVYHMTNLYFARQAGIERFLLVDGGVYPLLFWAGFVALGSLVPLVLLLHPAIASRRATLLASILVLAGAGCELYVFIIGGQAWPLEIFPGYRASSSFGDGAIAQYSPSLVEVCLGLGGVGVTFLLTTVGVRVLDFMPADAIANVPTRAVAAPPGAATAGPAKGASA
jgi:Ni/Fe-hydrogenase subunit HybB-like protein